MKLIRVCLTNLFLSLSAFSQTEDFEVMSFELSVADGWQEVTFSNQYTDAVVVTGAITDNDTDGVVAQVRNITDTSYEIRLVDWNTTGLHTAEETITCIAVEAGRHTVGGLIVEAGVKNDFIGNVAINANGQTASSSVYFDPITKQTDAVGDWNYTTFGQVVGEADADAIHVRNVNNKVWTDQYQFRFEKKRDATTAAAIDELHYVVIQAGKSDESSAINFESFSTSNLYNHNGAVCIYPEEIVNPFLMVSAPLVHGGDTTAMRINNITNLNFSARSDEPLAWDGTHAAEALSVFVIGNEDDALQINRVVTTTLEVADQVVVGEGASAAGDAAIAVGQNAVANGDNALAIGSNAQALANNSLAIGENAVTSGDVKLSVVGDSDLDGNLSVSGDLSVDGVTTLRGNVVLELPQGDISMGTYE